MFLLFASWFVTHLYSAWWTHPTVRAAQKLMPPIICWLSAASSLFLLPRPQLLLLLLLHLGPLHAWIMQKGAAASPTLIPTATPKFDLHLECGSSAGSSCGSFVIRLSLGNNWSGSRSQYPSPGPATAGVVSNAWNVCHAAATFQWQANWSVCRQLVASACSAHKPNSTRWNYPHNCRYAIEQHLANDKGCYRCCCPSCYCCWCQSSATLLMKHLPKKFVDAVYC